LNSDQKVQAPPLPGENWHPMTVEWWADLWASPMAPEYTTSDRHGLYMFARLVEDFWTADTPKQRLDAIVQVEKMWKQFGTAPLARRSLQWEIERTDEAQDRGKARRERTGNVPSKPAADPRNVLRAVK